VCAPLGERLAAFMREEVAGCTAAATSAQPVEPGAEVVDFMVSRGGIEPPTCRFSARSPNRFKLMSL
jgi:hypothetical protein